VVNHGYANFAARRWMAAFPAMMANVGCVPSCALQTSDDGAPAARGVKFRPWRVADFLRGGFYRAEMVPPPPPHSTRLRLRITAAAESAVRGGHPWVYAESIRELNREGRLGELAVIYDRRNRFLAIGLFDPVSPLRVRVLHTGNPLELDDSWWLQHLRAGCSRRRGLFDDRTNGYRWINGESDGWPGLVLDRYAGTVVMKLYTGAWLPWLEQMNALVQQELRPERLVLRLSRNLQSLAREQFHRTDGEIILGPPCNGSIVFLESGIHFLADVLRGQKTGFFLDQRENRRTVESLAPGRDVLNAFSYSGGFSLYAARGGANSVTDLDISAHALDSARANFQRNLAEPVIAACRHATIQADAFAWLDTNGRRQFDLVILDPPSLAKRESERAGAIRAYGNLANRGIEALRLGGILVAASCSAHVSSNEFFEVIRRVALASGRDFHEIQTTGHPADHPATMPEANYLKCIFIRFEPSPASIRPLKHQVRSGPA